MSGACAAHYASVIQYNTQKKLFHYSSNYLRIPDKRWIPEANAAACAYLDDPWIQRLIYKEFTKPDKRCFPYAVCCVPLILALNTILHIDHIFLERLEYANLNLLFEQYELHVSNPRVLITKQRYRDLRRLYKDDEAEEERLVANDFIHSDAIQLMLTQERCAELSDFFNRHATRFAR